MPSVDASVGTSLYRWNAGRCCFIPSDGLLNMLEIHSWESAAIKADGLKIFLGVNPTFFAVNADLDPDIRPNAEIDSTLDSSKVTKTLPARISTCESFLTTTCSGIPTWAFDSLNMRANVRSCSLGRRSTSSTGISHPSGASP